MNTRNKHIKSLLFFLLITMGLKISAHPHMFFTSYVNFIFNQTKIEGCYITWTFDSSFSADIIQGYDVNQDGKFDTNETLDVYNNAFIYTQNYNYFIFIRQDSKRFNPKEVKNFTVSAEKGLVSYRFYVDLSFLEKKEFYFGVYDHTYFCDIQYKTPEPVSFTGAPSTTRPSYTIIQNKKAPIYYNPFDTIEDTTVYYEWKEGLQTYYPKELFLRYN